MTPEVRCSTAVGRVTSGRAPTGTSRGTSRGRARVIASDLGDKSRPNSRDVDARVLLRLCEGDADRATQVTPSGASGYGHAGPMGSKI
jgi:hypothetical protein